MIKIQNPRDLDNVIEALANQHRREIIHVLSLGPCSISKLAFLRNLSLPAIHKHIEVLEKGDMIIRTKIGQTNFLALNRESFRGLQDWLMRYNPYQGINESAQKNQAQSLSRE
jgi:DNA-binding transcriptional ArsR family regulator